MLTQRLQQFLNSRIQPGQKVLLALSGGLDSRVLLQLLVQAQGDAQLDIQLSALYINHGLSPNADAWAAFCAAECEALGVAFTSQQVEVDRDSGLGVEASARQARYAALLATDADHILLAHHQDDQAETLLLQLIRGSGSKGLAAMASADQQRRLLRPLLETSRSELEAYAQQQGLKWVEDESNGDTHYDRNFCRHQVLPLLEQRFPAVKRNLARSASHLAESAELLDELAQLDAAPMQDQGRLHLPPLALLSEARARNVLRWWLASFGLHMPGTRRLQEMRKQLLEAVATATLKVLVQHDVFLRRFQDYAYLSLEPSLPQAPWLNAAPSLHEMAFLSESLMLAPQTELHWQGETEWDLPANGRLLLQQVEGEGLSLAQLNHQPLLLRYRSGGERMKPDAKRPTRTLKQLTHEHQVPPWLRERLPLLYLGETLAIIPGLGVASHLQAGPGEAGLVISWQPASLKSA